MSRGLSGVLLSAFDEDHIVTVVLVKLEFDSGTQRYHSGVGDITYLSETYIGVGDFGKIEPILEDRGVKMKGIMVALQGVDTTVVDLTNNESVQGRAATIYLAVYDHETAAITEGFELFSGYMDNVQMTRGTEATLSLSIESIMSQFDLPNVRRFTSEDHQERYPGDLFFNEMAYSNEARIVWGNNDYVYRGAISGGSSGGTDSYK